MERMINVNFSDKQMALCMVTFGVIACNGDEEVDIESVIICGSDVDVCNWAEIDMSEIEEDLLEYLHREQKIMAADAYIDRMENR